MLVVGGNPSSPRWGGTLSSHDGGTPSSHGAGTNPHLGWVDTIPGMGWVGVPHPSSWPIPGMGWVGVPHPSSWLSTLSRGYLPWLGGVPTLARGNYLGQEGTSSNVGTYSQGIYPLPRVHIPPSPSTLTRGTYLGQGGYVIE